jgi:hypothetical protein
VYGIEIFGVFGLMSVVDGVVEALLGVLGGSGRR